LITSELGRIPETGEQLQIGRLAIEITDVDETRVLEVRIRIAPETDAEDADGRGELRHRPPEAE
jgi:CBS domain containing-hemolysin-like protein